MERCSSLVIDSGPVMMQYSRISLEHEDHTVREMPAVSQADALICRLLFPLAAERDERRALTPECLRSRQAEPGFSRETWCMNIAASQPCQITSEQLQAVSVVNWRGEETGAARAFYLGLSASSQETDTHGV